MTAFGDKSMRLRPNIPPELQRFAVLNTYTVAQILGRSITTIRRMVRDGRLAARRDLRGGFIITRADVTAYIESLPRVEPDRRKEGGK